MSLQGSPTVSPVTVALWVSDFFPPNYPLSTYFLALSHAPPALLRNNAMRIPVDVENIINEANTCAPNIYFSLYCPIIRNKTPTTTGDRTANKPGFIISFSPAAATISTHYRFKHNIYIF